MESAKLNEMKAEFKAKHVAVIKEAVRLTFEKIEELEKQKNIIQNNIKAYKHDLFDLKDGRLDRILERHKIDENAKAISVLSVNKPEGVSQANVSPWYEEYIVCVSGAESIKINNSVTKTHASGTYKLNDGTIRSL